MATKTRNTIKRDASPKKEARIEEATPPKEKETKTVTTDYHSKKAQCAPKKKLTARERQKAVKQLSEEVNKAIAQHYHEHMKAILNPKVRQKQEKKLSPQEKKHELEKLNKTVRASMGKRFKNHLKQCT